MFLLEKVVRLVDVFFFIVSVFTPQTPGHAQDSKTLCCLCCKSGPIEADFHIEKMGFVPGEYLNFNANVENNT